MADSLTSAMLQLLPKSGKEGFEYPMNSLYIPYGKIDRVLPYLVRRYAILFFTSLKCRLTPVSEHKRIRALCKVQMGTARVELLANVGLSAGKSAAASFQRSSELEAAALQHNTYIPIVSF